MSQFIDVVTNSRVPANSIARHTLIKGPLTYKATLVPPPGTAQFPDPLVFPATALAPLPPSGIADNLLLASVSTQNLTLEFPVPRQVRDPDRDTVQLLVDGNPIGTAVSFTGFVAGETFEIGLPASARSEGTHSIVYRVRYFAGSGDEDGPNQTFRVDLTPPGRATLGRLIVDPDIATNGLTADKLKDDAGTEYLESIVPSYEGVEPGDFIQGYIDATVAPGSTTVNVNGGSNDDVELRFVRDDIEDADDGTRVFTYRITDRAGNQSPTSDPLSLRVLLKGELTGLLAPEVPSFDDDGIIDEADARGPAQVIIPAFTGTPGIQLGDQIQLVWGGEEHTLIAIPGGTEDQEHTVLAAYAALYDTWKAATGGANQVANINVLYRIVRNGLVAGTSPATTVDINLFQAGGDPDPENPEHPNLQAALLESSSGQQNEIPVEDFDKDATITVRWYDLQIPAQELFILNDRLNVTYGSTALTERTISAAEVAAKADLVLALTAAQIGSEGSGNKILKYTVTRAVNGGAENTSLSPEQDVLVSGTDELPGGGTLPDASYRPLNGNGVIGPNEIKAGVVFVTPHYLNKAVDDIISIDLVQYDDEKHNGGETPIEETRITLDTTVGPADKDTVTEFRLDPATLAFPLDLCHIHAEWSAENSAGSVTNDTTHIVIDSRGYRP